MYCLRSGSFVQKENERRLGEVDLKKMFIKFIELQAGEHSWIEKNAVAEKRLTQEHARARKLMRQHFSDLKMKKEGEN